MCRCTDPDGAAPVWRAPPRRALRIRAFHIRLLCVNSKAAAPETLTLVLLPGGPPLEVNGSKARPGAPTVLPLYRFRSAEGGKGEAVFASADRVAAGEGQRFEAYVGERVAVRGALRKGEEGWRLEVSSGGEVRVGVGVRVVGEAGEVVEAEVKLPVGKVRRKGNGFCLKLERIPEEGSCCCCCGDEAAEEEDWEVVEAAAAAAEVEVEGVRWAVDVGIWVMCLGVGLLVSKASTAYSPGAGRRRRGFLF